MSICAILPAQIKFPFINHILHSRYYCKTQNKPQQWTGYHLNTLEDLAHTTLHKLSIIIIIKIIPGDISMAGIDENIDSNYE